MTGSTAMAIGFLVLGAGLGLSFVLDRRRKAAVADYKHRKGRDDR